MLQPQPQQHGILISDLHQSSWKNQIVNSLSKARDGTCIFMDTSPAHYHWATMGPRRVEFFFFFFGFLGLHSWHMEVSRLAIIGVGAASLHHSHSNTRSKPWVCDLQDSSRQCWIHNPLSKARDWTYNLMVPSWIVSAELRQKLPWVEFKYLYDAKFGFLSLLGPFLLPHTYTDLNSALVLHQTRP